MGKTNLLEILQHVPPDSLDYQEWVNIGMALHHEGHTAADWDDWSRADRRYKPGECFRKWEGFHGAPSPVTAGTIVQLAKDRGWRPRNTFMAGHTGFFKMLTEQIGKQRKLEDSQRNRSYAPRVLDPAEFNGD